MIRRKERIKKIITSAMVGSVIITSTLGVGVNAVTVKEPASQSSINLSEGEDKLIDSIRLKWKEDLVGTDTLDINNPTITKKIKGYINQTKKYSESINYDSANDWLWSDLKDYKENPARITSMFNNVVSMTMAYSLPNDTYYRNQELKDTIIYALEWIYENAYNDTIEQYGNWWDWMIGIPARLNNIVILMYDDLTAEQIDKYMNSIQKFLSSIEPGSKYHTGANLADVCLNKLLQGVNEKNPEKIKEASEDIEGVFEYVTENDGFYPDGSYVQHGIVAYTGSYGNVLIEKISNIMFLLEGTPWSIRSESKNNIYKWIFDSFDPIIYKGYVMDMVRGRSISRYNGNGYSQASGIMEGMLKIAMISEENMARRINVLVKQWANEASSVLDFGTKFKSINVIGEFYKIMSDESIKQSVQGAEHHALNMMDKTIHERDGYALGIARSSNRISKYEFMNKENLKPWFQGDGMTYLYNNDLTQFSDDFWPTVDPYRMPGTTIDTRERKDKEIISGIDPGSPEQDEVYYELGESNWSGGSKLGAYGVSGMQIDNKYDSLTANKSWFMFDEEIVALGSGITNPDDFKTETVIENRKIRKDGLNKFTINGVEKVQGLGDEDKVENAMWAHLEGNSEGSDIGYYFPDGADINLLRDEREGNWFDINSSKVEANKVVGNNYLTMYIDHGKSIENEKYSYVLLPNKSAEEVREYSNDSKIQILRNDEKAHGVKHMELNMEGANFWSDGQNTSGAITSSNKASVMIKENSDKTLIIAVSDPTFEGDRISIEIDKVATKVISSDNRIENINLNDGKIIFDVNTSGAGGETFELLVQLGEINSEEGEKNQAPVIEGKDVKLFVGDKWSEELHDVIAMDNEDGELTDNIMVKAKNINLDKNSKVIEEGKYYVTFEVEDSKGTMAEKTFEVVVDKKINDKPNKPNNTNKPNKPNKLPQTGTVVGGSILAIIGGIFTAVGASLLKRKKK